MPVIFYAAVNYGAEGAGIAWFTFRLVWFLWWTPIVHKRFVPGFHLKWLFKGILPIAVITVIVALSIHSFVILDLNQNRLILLMQMIGLGLLLLSISMFSSQAIREKILKVLKR